MKYFLIFPRKQDLTFHANSICMKGQIQFSGKNKKNIINLLSAEIAKKVVKGKHMTKVNALSKNQKFQWVMKRPLLVGDGNLQKRALAYQKHAICFIKACKTIWQKRIFIFPTSNE